MRSFHFKQLDVFSDQPLLGNPLAVVLGADGLSDEQMAAFARWTNLSETTFLLKPTDPRADYRVRIFTTLEELPFAGHPTLGSCHAWLESGGAAQGEEIIQECGIGLVRIRREGSGLAFTAPPLLRSGEVDPELIEQIRIGMKLGAGEILDARWVDNGPGWVAFRLADRASVLSLQPDYTLLLSGLILGVVAPWDPAVDGDEAQFEVRAFIPGDGMAEDPVTGSLNAGIARWFLEEGLAPDNYIVSQGTVLGRKGRVSIQRVGEDIWVGGSTVTCIEGRVSL
ncbi:MULTISPECIES: PhzF family phenazine biosynthesis protein [Pseudomonas]|uniref:Phenazine biosynthesis protein PhzF n=3 Tax=Pseudomonas savastanoi TaxID=29438 RepID=A0A0P9VEW1_PSESS|nr:MULTISPECIES: PhzF family phenazine biosynthesis protein [Pseudomonas]ARD12637.1 phenazine biosynthesis protein PhzF [Pseudomonas savastanoi pv. savastanoi NCPPB 3335]KAA3539521.1 PhzF family phenazine biosynthesis protein [Pseudomonas savastanoi]KPB18341.1 Phenazine biosynthesis protein PhzF like protein [Pseudomonas savastanoi]KPW74731.1 Phenazine biosynthesis protein PhzF [Pseudomonas amygdali pv. ciccaronei]KPX99806.1 Phenazine biosynthesis protein PhzF [Pseudomonas savastanoi pv. nerii